MFQNLAGFILAFTVTLHIWMIWTISRQRVQSLLSPLYIYLNILLSTVELTVIFFFQTVISPASDTIFKIHYVTEVFIPPILIYLTETYLNGKRIPSFSIKNILFFSVSVILSILGFTNLTIDGYLETGQMIAPAYTDLYWLVIIYYYFTFGFLLFEFLEKYQNEKRQNEAQSLKFLFLYVIPVALFGFTALKLLPMWNVLHPALYLLYSLLSLVIFSIAIRLDIIELDDEVSRPLSFFIISFLVLVPLSLLLPQVETYMYFLSIPVLIFFLVIFRLTDALTIKKWRDRSFNSEYDLEEELITLFNETEKYIDNQALAQFIGELSLKVLNCTKCAVITSRFDVKPYQVSFLKGFESEEVDVLLSTANSPFLETIEFNRTIINKFDLSTQSALYKLMSQYQIYLGIPMVSQNKLHGIILLGGDRKRFRLTNKDLKFARFLSIKSAYAFENIQEIQKVVQSQKMADLGVVASQLAHDFQSFITLVKLQTKKEDKLRQQADNMEKLVKDLLNYSRPKELKLSLININELIDMSLDLVKFDPGISIERHYSETVPKINIDIDQMRRVFTNILENSLKSIKNGSGRIKITTRPLRPLSNFRRNTWLYIEVLDDGEGIPEEFLDKIFEPFFTTRKNEGGSGLGLAIVRQIIESHKGFIDVTSKLGKGTIFNIRLPYLR
jgi:signal transduction histidine kinase